MNVLTLLQPWAWLIVHGPKRWENRTWTTPYRGPLVIHAGRSRQRLAEAYNNADLAGLLPDPSGLVSAALIGIVDLTRIEPIGHIAGEPFAEGPWCWRLDNPRPLPRPIPMEGGRSLWDVLDSIITLESTPGLAGDDDFAGA